LPPQKVPNPALKPPSSPGEWTRAPPAFSVSLPGSLCVTNGCCWKPNKPNTCSAGPWGPRGPSFSAPAGTSPRHGIPSSPSFSSTPAFSTATMTGRLRNPYRPCCPGPSPKAGRGSGRPPPSEASGVPPPLFCAAPGGLPSAPCPPADRSPPGPARTPYPAPPTGIVRAPELAKRFRDNPPGPPIWGSTTVPPCPAFCGGPPPPLACPVAPPERAGTTGARVDPFSAPNGGSGKNVKQSVPRAAAPSGTLPENPSKLRRGGGAQKKTL